MPEPPLLGTVALGHQHACRPNPRAISPSRRFARKRHLQDRRSTLQVCRFQQELLQPLPEAVWNTRFIEIIGQLGPRSGQAVDMALEGNAAIVRQVRQLNRDRPPLGPLNQLPRNLLVQRLIEQRSYVPFAESKVVDRDLVDFTLQSQSPRPECPTALGSDDDVQGSRAVWMRYSKSSRQAPVSAKCASSMIRHAFTPLSRNRVCQHREASKRLRIARNGSVTPRSARAACSRSEPMTLDRCRGAQFEPTPWQSRNGLTWRAADSEGSSCHIRPVRRSAADAAQGCPECVEERCPFDQCDLVR